MSGGNARPRIRPLAGGDESALNDAFNAVFGTSRTIEEWRWKYPEQPHGRYLMLAVEEGGAVAAHYGAVPVRLSKGSLEVTAGQICDVFTRPEARAGLGAARLFVGTYNAFVKEWCRPEVLAVCYGFPGTRALGLGLARQSYDDVPPQEVPYWRKNLGRRRPTLPSLRYRVREGYDRGAVGELWRRSRSRYWVAAVRDAAWFDRRFVARPGVAYTHLSVWHGGLPHAWAVVRRLGDGLQWAELVWDGEDPRSLARLESAVEREARRCGAGSVELWLGGDQEAAQVLGERGWVSMRQPADLHLIVRIFHPSFQVADFPGRLYLTMGDGDLV